MQLPNRIPSEFLGSIVLAAGSAVLFGLSKAGRGRRGAWPIAICTLALAAAISAVVGEHPSAGIQSHWSIQERIVPLALVAGALLTSAIRIHHRGGNALSAAGTLLLAAAGWTTCIAAGDWATLVVGFAVWNLAVLPAMQIPDRHTPTDIFAIVTMHQFWVSMIGVVAAIVGGLALQSAGVGIGLVALPEQLAAARTGAPGSVAIGVALLIAGILLPLTLWSCHANRPAVSLGLISVLPGIVALRSAFGFGFVGPEIPAELTAAVRLVIWISLAIAICRFVFLGLAQTRMSDFATALCGIWAALLAASTQTGSTASVDWSATLLILGGFAVAIDLVEIGRGVKLAVNCETALAYDRGAAAFESVLLLGLAGAWPLALTVRSAVWQRTISAVEFRSAALSLATMAVCGAALLAAAGVNRAFKQQI